MSPKTQNKIVVAAFFLGLAVVFAPLFFENNDRDDLVAEPADALPGTAETGMDEATEAKR